MNTLPNSTYSVDKPLWTRVTMLYAIEKAKEPADLNHVVRGLKQGNSNKAICNLTGAERRQVWDALNKKADALGLMQRNSDSTFFKPLTK